MKKLLVLVLVANVAVAEGSFVSGMKQIGSEMSEQLAEIIAVPAEAIKDGSVRFATTVKDVSKKAASKVSDAASSVKNSEFGQDVADVAGQFVAFPVERYEDAKDALNAAVDATKTFGKKIGDSRFAAKVKGANKKVVNASKKAATKVKDAVNEVVNSDFIQGTKEGFIEVGEQFAEAPREAWERMAAFFTAIKSELAD